MGWIRAKASWDDRAGILFFPGGLLHLTTGVVTASHNRSRHSKSLPLALPEPGF
jgi:hypothetical protein